LAGAENGKSNGHCLYVVRMRMLFSVFVSFLMYMRRWV
jgi:hypothetical protein